MRNSFVDTDKSSPCMHRIWLGVDSGVSVRKQTRHHVACTAREGTLLWILAKLLVHALCLDWGRFWRSGQTTNTALCVYSAMIEGMRYKVYLLLQGRVVHPVMDMDRAPRACTVSGLESIRAFPSESKHGKLTWHHVAYVACEGTLLWIQTKLPVHAPCLDWSRFGRSRQKAHTVSCSMCSS